MENETQAVPTIEERLAKIENALFPKPVEKTAEQIKAEQDAAEQAQKEAEERQKKADEEQQAMKKLDEDTQAIAAEMMKLFGEFADSAIKGAGMFPDKTQLDHFVIKAVPRLIAKGKELNFKPVYVPKVFQYFMAVFEFLQQNWGTTENFQVGTIFKYKVGKNLEDMTYQDMDVILKAWGEEAAKKTEEQRKTEGIPEVKAEGEQPAPATQTETPAQPQA